ncbi:MAG: TM2 domain-containing protein [Gemmatimonadota bacterium]
MSDPEVEPGGPDAADRKSALRSARVRARLARREARRPLEPRSGAPSGTDPAALFHYPRKRRWMAYLLWVTTGLMGGHRFYLRRHGTATLQFLTGGGLLLWWIVDAWLIPRYVRAHNEEQRRRESARRPPVALAFLGDDPDTSLEGEPPWVEKLTGLSSVVGDAAVLTVAGVGLGAISAEAGDFGPILAVVLLAVSLNLGHRLEPMRDKPVVGDLLAWGWRLRLFYHRVGPGSAVSRLFRSVTAFVVDPFREKRRAEAELYLQLGGVLAIVFGLLEVGVDLVGPLVSGAALVGLVGGWFESTIATFLIVYAFAVPVGATLSRPLLARRPRGELWGLTAWAAVCVLLGLAAG